MGCVGLDPFDRTWPDGPGALGLDVALSLKTEVVLLRAPPSRCHAESVAAHGSKALPAWRVDRVIAGASHGDFESPSDWMCAIACGAPDPARQAQVRAALIEALDRWLPRIPRTPRTPRWVAPGAAFRGRRSRDRCARGRRHS